MQLLNFYREIIMEKLPVPFRLDFFNLAVDDTAVFCIAMLLAVMVNAEAQAFTATSLGDSRTDDKGRFHFNAFLHIDIIGLLCFMLAGFGWPREMKITAKQSSHPRLFLILSRFAGPAANFLLANIAASVVWLMSRYGAADRVFTILAAVNLTVAVYSILPFPPLAGASLVSVWIPDHAEKFRQIYHRSGPLILLGIFLAEKISGIKFLSSILDPVVVFLFQWISGV